MTDRHTDDADVNVLRRWGLALLLGLLLAVFATAWQSTSAPAAGPRAQAAAYKHCGYIGAEGRGRFKVIEKGSVSCRGARKLMNLFMNEGQGTKHGGPSNAQTYYTLHGWKCGYGAGAGGCVRRGARVQAGWVR